MNKVTEDLFLIPDMVAGGNDIHAIADQVLCNAGRDAKTGCGVLTVCDDDIDAFGGPNVLQMISYDAASGMAEDVTDEY